MTKWDIGFGGLITMMMRISSAQSHLIESKPLAIPFDEKLTRPYRCKQIFITTTAEYWICQKVRRYVVRPTG